MANLEKIKDVRDCRRANYSPTIKELRERLRSYKNYGVTIGEIEAMISEYEDIIEYLVERLVHSETERFSK